MIPSDPLMLLSYVNTKLRDQYAALDDLCDDLDVAPHALCDRLSAIGYRYDRAHNRFLAV